MFRATFVFVVFLLCVMSAGSVVASVKSEDAQDSVIVNAKTKAATITLKSTPSTGYRWYLKSYPSDIFSSVNYDYLPPSQEMPGSPGKAQFTFKVSGQASTVPRIVPVVLVNARSWEPSSGQIKTIWIVIPKETDE